jgi:photosystem II stability/assembly factor-like uncharacterized protein
MTVLIISPYTTAAPTQRGGWISQDSGVTSNLNTVAFICLNRGSAAGNLGTILRTSDGGNNWTQQDAIVSETINDISYYGYTTIVAAGSSGTIWFTNNSGQNWTVKQTGMMATYYGVQMINQTVGIAVGVNAIFQPFVTKTTDGWTTWDDSSFYFILGDTLCEGKLSDVHFLNATYGFASGIIDLPAGGAIVRTTDGGNTWQIVYFGGEALYGIDVTQDGVIYAVGDGGLIVQSPDGGQTWNEQQSGVSKPLYSIDFPSEAVGFAVGYQGIILRTGDNGTTWVQQTSGVTTTLFGVQFVGDVFGWAVGQDGTILHTITGGMPQDIWPPVTNVSLAGNQEGEMYTSNVTVTFTASDNLSGIAETLYSLDAGSWTTYTGPFLIISEGTHVLKYYSVDNAGNAENANTAQFTIEFPLGVNVTISGGFGFHILITNTGTDRIQNASWDLSLTGGRLFFQRPTSGVVSLESGDEITLHVVVLGFGQTRVTFTLVSSQTVESGRVFFCFVKI